MGIVKVGLRTAQSNLVRMKTLATMPLYVEDTMGEKCTYSVNRGVTGRDDRISQGRTFSVEESIRLICPECDTVHRVKRLTLGKQYKCKRCQTPLVTLESASLVCPQCGASSPPTQVDVSRASYCSSCPSPTLLQVHAATEADGGSPHVPAETSQPEPVRETVPAVKALVEPVSTGVPELRNDLSRLVELTENLSRRLDGALTSDSESGERLNMTAMRMAQMIERMERRAEDQERSLVEQGKELQALLEEWTQRAEPEAIREMGERFRESGQLVLSGFGEAQAKLIAELARQREDERNVWREELDGMARLAASEAAHAAGTAVADASRETTAAAIGQALAAIPAPPAIDLDEFGERLTGQMGQRIKDEVSPLVASAAEKIDQAVVAIPPPPLPDLDELSSKVADRVGGQMRDNLSPLVSSAISDSMPDVIAGLRTDALEDAIGKVVRESQRPFLREVMNRGWTVPAWLFVAVVGPLVFVLGYVLFPIVAGYPTEKEKALEDEIRRLTVREEGDIRKMRENVEAMDKNVGDMNQKGWAHAENAAKLSERVKNLEQVVSERDKLTNDYASVVDRQAKMIRIYEAQIYRLGATPDQLIEPSQPASAPR